MSITSAADTSMNAVSPESTAWAAGACASSAGARHRSRALVSRNRRLIGLLVTFLTAENAEIAENKYLSACFAISAVKSRCGGSIDVALACPDPVALFDGHHEHAPVADFAGARRLDDRLDAVVYQSVGHDDFDFHLRQQADVVFLATIDGGVPLLLAVTAHLGHRHPRHAQPGQRVLHLVHFVRPDDALNQLHDPPPATAAASRRARPAPRRRASRPPA